jgi:signal recognition particle subunit SRP54
MMGGNAGKRGPLAGLAQAMGFGGGGPSPEQMAELAKKMPGGQLPPGMPGAGAPGLPPGMPKLPPNMPGKFPNLPGLGGGKFPGLPGLPGGGKKK